MNVFLSTCTPQFANDLLDVVKIFDYDSAFVAQKENADLVILHTEETKAEERVCQMTVSGKFTGYYTLSETIRQESLEEKRLHKRQIKRTLYTILKQETDFQPPWGSLTGVRPMRLLHLLRETGLSEEETLRALHETFDITGEKLRLMALTAQTQKNMPGQKNGETDLYIGIPFCVSRCAYCSFLSGEIGNGKQLAPYVDALIREIESVKWLVSSHGLTVRAVYVGGGTPTALPAELLEKVLKSALDLTRHAAEFTVEAGRPDTCDEERLRVLKEAGVGRISINPQTMHDNTLAAIGRRHTCAETEKAFFLARKLGFQDINMDLIAGLPGENEEMFLQTLERIRSFAPESLSIHALSIKRASLLHAWKETLPNGAMTARMVQAGFQEALFQGMRPYYLYRQKNMAGNLENVGYAKPGMENLYNVGMMEELSQVISVGAGGISKKVNTRTGKILRVPNVSNIDEYIARVDEMAARKEQLFS